MPIYEYQCQACQHTLEAMQKMSDAPLTDCPACHHPKLQRLVSAVGFQLKGTGWYATDFKNSGKPKTEPQATAKPADGSKTASDNTSTAKETGASSSATTAQSSSSDKTGTGS